MKVRPLFGRSCPAPALPVTNRSMRAGTSKKSGRSRIRQKRPDSPPTKQELAGDSVRRDRSALSFQRAQIAVLVDTLDQDYQNSVLHGIEDEAETLSLRVCCFALGSLKSRTGHHFELCAPGTVQGLIVLAGTFAQDSEVNALSDYCARFSSIPVCSIGGTVEDAVELAVDSRSGMKEALLHLSGACGRGRIAFVRGPKDNNEAEERYRSYLRGLGEVGLGAEEALVVQGDFLEPSGVQAISILLDRRRQGFDAILAANDLMALGAMKELISRGVAVPDKVAVVGYDDIRRARFTEPPLATVRQPVYEQGRCAVREVVARISESALPQRVVLSAGFVARGSCGARTLSSYVAGLVPSPGDVAQEPELRFEETYRKLGPQIILDVRNVLDKAGFPYEEGLAETLLVQASTDILGQRRGILQRRSFVVFVEETIRGMDPTPGVYISAWQEVITVLQRHLGPCLRGDTRLKRRAEGIWNRSRSAISYLAERGQASRWLSETMLLGAIHHATTQLLNAESLEQLGRHLNEALEQLEITRCFVARELSRNRYVGVFLIDGGCVVSQIPGEFNHDQLAPSNYLEASSQCNCLLKPFEPPGSLRGYILFDKTCNRSHVYSALRDSLASSLSRLMGQDFAPKASTTCPVPHSE